ncbi:2-hydroxyacid dehydrogenase [Paenibacillus arenilitoris]|uniref:D-glycerate dehydrogenase n=1 Tax=Paenibacillus arenilitoris TaxID=2772299 RepID=A0A927H6U2_9BACL|nr:D-glycerate dehydrogenase [Paenibacillus arenilitoris]MBD2869928.1 D-glycerate dehydrogenase [Paenibacillus arenilitoris]
MKPTVFIDRKVPDEVKAYISEHCAVEAWEDESTIPRPLLLEKLAKADGLLTSGRRIDAELLDSAPRLKVVSSISVGYNHFDLQAMRERGVIGTHTPFVLDDTVADLALALMLGTARRVAELDRYVKEGRWASGDGVKLFGRDVHHATLGIIGMGRIGEAVARRARFGFEMEVLYTNRSRKPEAEQQLGVRYAELKELLAQSDFVVMLAPLTAETTRMIGREQFRLMKKTAFFINVSRGQTIDEAALIEALQDGTIAGAGLDVYEKEPVAADNPLLLMDNVLALPHIGSATDKTRFDMAMLAAQNLVGALTGSAQPHIVAELR